VKRILAGLLTFSLLAACSPAAASSSAAPRLLAIQYSAAARPWLAEVYACAGETPVVAEQRAASFFDPSADLAIRLGEPEQLAAPAYAIGVEEIVVVVHPQNPARKFDLAAARGLFGGRIRNWSELGGADLPVQAWIYAPGEDIQQVFAASVMQGAATASLARLAASPDEMAQAIAADAGAVGFLPRRWLTGNVREVYTIAAVSVLAITPVEPDGAVKELLACVTVPKLVKGRQGHRMARAG
jgi:hypothetical protein